MNKFLTIDATGKQKLVDVGVAVLGTVEPVEALAELAV
jgi:hypothetical protein